MGEQNPLDILRERPRQLGLSRETEELLFRLADVLDRSDLFYAGAPGPGQFLHVDDALKRIDQAITGGSA